MWRTTTKWGEGNERKYIVVNWDEHEILEKMGLTAINESINSQTKRRKNIDDATDEDNEIISLYRV